jgi:hypothetical protein
MSEIFVFTAASVHAQAHYERTIRNTVPVSELAAVDPLVAGELTSLGFDEVRCWGSKPGPQNLRSWAHMEPGHWGLLYVGRERFPLALPLIHKAYSPSLATHLWGRDESDGSTWERMFFFGEPRAIGMSIDEVRVSLGYDDAWWPQGLQYPTVEHQEALLEKFGSVDAFVGSTGDGSPPATAPASAQPSLLGGPFNGVPSAPPKLPVRDPNPDADVSGRGYMAHEQTVAKLVAHVGPSLRKGTPGINHDGAWTVGDEHQLVEVKSITSRNEVSQLQKGLGQVLHNCHKARQAGFEPVLGYLLAEREPANSSLWRTLCEDHGIVFSWPERFEADVRRPASKP